MWLDILLLIAVSIIALIFFLITYARKNYGQLEKLGIPVVKPHFFLGSSPHFYKIVNHFQDLEWFKTYGEVYGAYEGRQPTVHIINPDMVRQIMIKDFDHFRNHDKDDLFGDGHILNQMMDLLKDEKWKVVRSMMSPTFTTAKLKRLRGVMRDVSEEFVIQTKDDLRKSYCGVLENINLYEEMFKMLTDMVARITLNIKIDNAKDPNNDFASAIRELFYAGPPFYIYPLTQAFPFLNRHFSEPSLTREMNFFTTVFRKVMDNRKNSGQRSDDFIDFLIGFKERTVTDDEFKRLGITETTVIANAVEFYIAGQDSMSTAITMLAYYLTKNPDIEKKLYDEIDMHLKNLNLDEKLNLDHEQDSFGDLTYLNACLYEVLRLHPTFPRTDRLCNKDWEYKGLHIKKGMTVVIPFWSYHRNPKYFPDPEKFDPERFMPYNRDRMDPMTYCIFGHGPRMCIGMRFAFECLIAISLSIFREFRFKARFDTEVKYAPGLDFAAIGPVKLDLVQRIHSK